MAYIPPETVAQARQVDLLTYMKACEPEELVHISGDHYCTREHDSLKYPTENGTGSPVVLVATTPWII